MEKIWYLFLNVKEQTQVEKNCHYLCILINQTFNEQLDDKFVPYIQKLIQDQIQLYQQNKGLLYRFNEILNSSQEKMIEKFTRKEIYTILLMMYFNLIQNNFNKGGFYLTNMDEMKYSRNQKGQEKHKCFLHYFKIFYQNFKNREQEEVIFIRDNSSQQEIDLIPKDVVMEISKQFSVKQKLINDIESDNVLVDFADKNVGGLVLDGWNCAQEEIILLCYPEGVISSLFMKPMQNNEAILIQNVIRYNYSKGYEDTFTHDAQKRQEVIIHHILMIDAQQYFNPSNQYSAQEKNREILKCFTGFKLALKCFKDKNITISTGKWGCGIFRGDLTLKFLIQVYGFCLAKQGLKLNDKSNIRFGFLNDAQFENLIKQFQDSFQKVQQISKLIEIIYAYQSQN